MVDLNHIRIFERVATLTSFSAAARELGLPRSNVSRAVSKLEEALGARLVHRTTREVVLTPAGTALFEKTAGAMADLDVALDYVGNVSGKPAGPLRISAGIGLGINVLSQHLPEFLARYPDIQLKLHLESARVDLLSSRIDAAIRFGELADSSLVSRRLGTVPRLLCAAPAYLAQNGAPQRPEELADHKFVDYPTPDGRSRHWVFRIGKEEQAVAIEPKVIVDEVLTIHRMVRGGAGIGVVSSYLCEEDLAEGRLIHVLPEWSVPSVPLWLLFPSRRELAPSVRAFADFLAEIGPKTPWRAGQSANGI